MKKIIYLTTFLFCSYAISATTTESTNESTDITSDIEVKQQVLDSPSWIIVYNKAENVIKITDFNDQEKSIVLPETEGLLFISGIIRTDPSKVKDFSIE